jgi:hypothetical protein
MEKEGKIGVGLVLYVTYEMGFQTDDTEDPTGRRVRMQGGNLNELERVKLGQRRKTGVGMSDTGVCGRHETGISQREHESVS